MIWWLLDIALLITALIVGVTMVVFGLFSPRADSTPILADGLKILLLGAIWQQVYRRPVALLDDDNKKHCGPSVC